jgi:peptidyl-prolyl cis-trans isomerase B (cyclophilin B)
VLIPTRIWFAPAQPIMINAKADGEITVVLTDFTGKSAEKGPVDVKPGEPFDLRAIYPEVNQPGTRLLFAVPKDKPVAEFIGTPLVISTRADRRQANAPMVTRIEPLRYATMETDHGEMTMVFYYDVAPHTVASFQTLAEQGFYNGLTFHRIVPGFVIQGGDPKGDGTGGPGYQIDAEFNERRHEEGVLSMARSGDPLEAQGAPPRCEFANSAGSQFFVCLEYKEHLDRKYTAFGRVVRGLETVKKIAAVQLADPASGRPMTPPVIQSVRVAPVTAEKNPYTSILPNLSPPAAPATPATPETPAAPAVQK